jgi:dCMP deaminase
MRRTDYISWDDLFMGIAELTSKRSKDPSTRHGACIIDPNTHKVIAIGYNGLPKGMYDGLIEANEFEFPLSMIPKEGHFYDCWEHPQKNELVVHAEENAIFNATKSLEDATLYLYSEKGYYPCSRCARGIVQVGIKEIVLKTTIKENTAVYNWDYTKYILNKGGVLIRVLNEY